MAKTVALVAAGTVATVGANGSAVASDDYNTLTVQINVTAISGATPSLTVSIDVSCDGGATFTQAAVGAAITATGSQLISVGPGMPNGNGIGNAVRVRYAIAGTTPSVTFGAQGTFKEV